MSKPIQFPLTTATLWRRDFLRGLLLSPVALSFVQSALLAQTRSTSPPAALKHAGRELTTSNPDFFIRNHFQTPQINSDTWSLEVTGLVSTPLKLSYSDLLLMTPVRFACTVECAGNLSGGKGVGNAVWSGVSVASLLKQAGVQSQANTLVLHGVDSGSGDDLPPGTHFARSIPLEKAMSDSTVLAYEMNGSPLPPDHGFPLRAIVGGWYGMDSVKWLTRIVLTDQPFQGYFQQKHYVAIQKDGTARPITQMLVSSKFVRPSQDEEIHEKTYRLEGVAWAGERNVAKVEVRTNDSEAWQTATVSATPYPYVWTSWHYDWHVPGPGKYALEVRATDEAGSTQPEVRDSRRQDAYELNTSHRINVMVR